MAKRAAKKEEPIRPIPCKEQFDLVVQYLNWAIIAAHKGADPDCSEVNIKVDLDRKSTTTSYTKRGKETRPKAFVSLREATVLRDLCNRRIASLEGAIDKSAGSLYPGIWTSQIQEIEALFERLTTYPLNREEA